MIKFWSDDFKYIKRFGNVEPFGYLFKVRGESANYLINKYQLDYPNVFVNCYLDKTIYVGSRSNDNLTSDVCDCEDGDIDELYIVLKPFITIDMCNYEEYLADDWYQKDDRWE